MRTIADRRRRGRVAWPALFAAVMAAVSAAGAETYTIDTAHSAVGFKIRHLFSDVAGRFTQFEGHLEYVPQQPESSRIELVIQAASIDTDNENRDNHLRSGDFFEVETHPRITFQSRSIAPAGPPNHFQVTGDLTIRGVTRPVAVAVELLGFGDFAGMGHRGGFRASATVPRADFGVSWNRVLEGGGAILGDDVRVEVALEVVRQ